MNRRFMGTTITMMIMMMKFQCQMLHTHRIGVGNRHEDPTSACLALCVSLDLFFAY